MAAAWPGIFVHESNLKVNMHSLRRSLGDTQKQPLYIATIAGRGYRFVAPVQRAPPPNRRRGHRSEAGESSRLPLPLPSRDIVAREPEIAHLLALLRGRSLGHRGLGAAGIGKTTVAVAAAHAFAADCPDGVCFVDLSTIDDPTFLPSALVAALGLRGDMGDALTAVVDHLRQRSILSCWTIASMSCRPSPSLPASSVASRGRPSSWPPAANRWAYPPKM